jgi:predicted nucleotidyltransferase
MTEIRHTLKRLIREQEEILFAYIHGSFVEGRPYHDIDVAIHIAPEILTKVDVFDYEMDLSTRLTLSIHVPVDVHILDQAPLGFRHSVFQGELLFTRDEELLTDYIERVGWDYMQFAYHIREYLLEVMS